MTLSANKETKTPEGSLASPFGKYFIIEAPQVQLEEFILELQKYVQFESVKDMDNHIDEVLKTFDLNDTTRELLLLLSRYSVKFVGVSYMKVDTISTLMKRSKRTIQRSLNVLKGLGIIERIETMRDVSGGNGASITLICRSVPSLREEPSEPCETINEESIEEKETIISKSKNNKLNNNVLKRNEVQHDISYIEGTVDSWFIKLSSPFFNNKLIKKLWKKAQQCFEWYSSVPYMIDEETITRAFKVSVYAYKNRKIRDFVGYFFSTLRNMIEDIECELAAQKRREAVKNNNLPRFYYNWLEVEESQYV